MILTAGASHGESPTDENPLLPFCTFLGGSSSDAAKAAVLGPDGALWIVGSSYSTDFPGAPREAGPENGGDVVVLRFDPATWTVLSAAWIGSTDYDSPAGLAFDGQGNAFVAGTTGNSATFPATAGIPNPGDWNSSAFVARVLPDGSGFAWAAVLGGTGWDQATGIAVTSNGDPVICGVTHSADFPLKNPLQPAPGGDQDAFVARVRADGAGFVFSTYLGGSRNDGTSAVAIAADGGIVLSGNTRSEDFPAGGRLLGVATGGSEGFLAEIDPDGAAIRRASLLGDTNVHEIASPSPESLLLLGRTASEDFPAPRAPHGAPGAPGDAFLLRLGSTDWEILGGTLFGGSGREYYLSMASATDGTVWLAGSTDSTDLPLSGAIRPLLGSSEDAFVAAFARDDFALLFSTYLGGNARDLAGGIAVASDGSALIAGATGSDDFPEAYSVQGRASPSPEYDMFVARLNPGDTDARPPAPERLEAEVLGANAVRLRWEDRSSDEVGFAVYRRKDLGFGRVAFLAAGTTEWVDGTVLPDRHYEYAVQAVSPAGGSPASAPAEAQTPPTLDIELDPSLCRVVPDWFDGTSILRMRGTLTVNTNSTDGTLDPMRDGVEWVLSPPGSAVLGPDGRNVRLLSIPAEDPGWKSHPRGLQWKSGSTRLRFDPSTGRFELRLRAYGWLLWPDESRPMRVTVGDESGSSSPFWRSAGHFRQRTP